ncbi:MAG: GNAT family N-acetyltransferase [Nitrospinae bacterium]|nr:GNAT family N-acetyltransferase [Nitrospinota bacterium]
MKRFPFKPASDFEGNILTSSGDIKPRSFSRSFSIKPYQEGDENKILKYFSETFPRKREEAEWNWIYRNTTSGARIMLGWSETGEVAAHYAALINRAILNNEEIFIGNVRDIFTAPHYRGAREGRKLLIVETAQEFFDAWTGPGKMPFCFGFPNSRHTKLGKLTMNYREFSHWHFCRLELSGYQHQKTGATGKVNQVETFDNRFDELWNKEKNKRSFSPVRDASFLNWRFVNNPSQKYQIWSYSPFLSKEVSGYIVVLIRSNEAFLVDFHFPPSLQASCSFWGEIIDILRWNGIKSVSTWFSSAVKALFLMKELGFTEMQKDPKMEPVFRSFHPNLDEDWCNANFYCTMADSDLY